MEFLKSLNIWVLGIGGVVALVVVAMVFSFFNVWLRVNAKGS